MQTFISPIGFDTTSVTRTVMNHGLDGDDVVILVRPARGVDDDRGSEAVTDIDQLLQEIDPTIKLQTEELPHDDFEAAVMQCSELLTNAEGELVVSLSGGARDILLPLTVAAMAHSEALTTTYGFSDIDRNVRELPLPTITTQLSAGAHSTLTAIADADGELTIPQLTDRVEAVKSTVTRHVNTLEAADYLNTWLDDRTKHLSITLSGQLYLATQSSIEN